MDMQPSKLQASLHERIPLSRAMGAMRLAPTGALLALLAACAATSPRYPVPVLPVSKLEQLRTDALRATPPVEEGEFRASELVELVVLDPSLKLDVRYAGSDNFLRAPIYPEARVFLQRPAAEAVVRVNRALQAQGYGLLLFDGYRPWYVTKLFWEATPQEKRDFVADPAVGSRHNRGCAIDLSLYDLKTGLEVRMPSAYDEFSERAHPSYTGGTPEQRAARDLLRKTMEAEGFTVNDTEWWHFDHRDWQSYRIGTELFKYLPRAN
jgi:D-alanyl-D-alanine dipeptidase